MINNGPQTISIIETSSIATATKYTNVLKVITIPNMDHNPNYPSSDLFKGTPLGSFYSIFILILLIYLKIKYETAIHLTK